MVLAFEKKLYIIFTLFFLLITPVFPAAIKNDVVIEIYGTKQISVNDLLNKYNDDIQQYIRLKNESDTGFNNKQINNTKKRQAALIKAMAMEDKITREIMTEGSFSSVNPSLVHYNGNKTAYLTIDIVNKKDQQRLSHFLPNPTKNIPDPDHLIHHWIDYENTAIQIENAGKLHRSDTCPAWHCIWGYDHPALKKYSTLFFNSVPKNQNNLLNILKNDKIPRKRAAAAYLLAHIKDGHALAKMLSTFMFDPDMAVRNNVMRVIAMTSEKIDLPDFPIEKAIMASTLPTASDRNKSLYIINSLLKNQTNKQLVAKQMLPQLLDMLRQQQMTTHEPAYDILKKISGKQYGDRNYSAWEAWATKKYGFKP